MNKNLDAILVNGFPLTNLEKELVKAILREAQKAAFNQYVRNGAGISEAIDLAAENALNFLEPETTAALTKAGVLTKEMNNCISDESPVYDVTGKQISEYRIKRMQLISEALSLGNDYERRFGANIDEPMTDEQKALELEVAAKWSEVHRLMESNRTTK